MLNAGEECRRESGHGKEAVPLAALMILAGNSSSSFSFHLKSNKGYDGDNDDDERNREMYHNLQVW
jgi:hypothetical protein